MKSFSVIAAALAAALGMNVSTSLLPSDPHKLRKGTGGGGNKFAKSSFKQNKRRGL